jgi:S1-C subfamily serine protease
MRGRLTSAIAALTAAGVLGLAGCTGGGSEAPPAANAATGPSTSSGASGGRLGGPKLQQAYVKTADQVRPSVVQVRTGKALGSGIVWDGTGHIVTNAHVVGGSHHFTVRLAGSAAPLSAHLVGKYRPDDLAVIQLDTPPSNLEPAQFGNSDALEVGDLVLAMGNPLGLAGTVTEGIVSATDRTVTEPSHGSGRDVTLPNTIQTSASINPGNSGGALVDMQAKVIGIPTLAAVDKEIGGGSAAPGIGFAISAKLVKQIVPQLVEHGRVLNSHRAALRARVKTVAQNGNPVGVGVVDVTRGGPAQRAGIKPGWIVTKFDHHRVRTTTELGKVLAGLHPGQRVPLTARTPGGQTRMLTITLGERPS